MKKVIAGKLSGNRYRVKDYLGKEKVLVSKGSFNVGDSVVVVNDIIVGKTKREVGRIYEV